MAGHPGRHVLAAAAVTAGVLAGRWWFTRTRRDHGHGAGSGHDRVVSLHAAFLDLTGDQTLKAADAHLDRYWASISPLYPR
ncbi:hypothetical protein [Streptomyces sp. NPDC005533]|uniref:hypothetical protein n=1 Tax=Streptomyces sp. NPDC005533 TaxID=3364723 RepID=UPI0036B061A4